ncbi:heme exporter protein CcmD [Marinicella sp. W31]|uniref:heme exporter protein CcmD n=1 Tax=Marinicella sp. W31 TaxID=3023713 RepID=UPI0037568962
MPDFFDMGEYNFFVWGSIAVFVIVLLADGIFLQMQQRRVKRSIRALIRRKKT